jgi:tetratricopeptide (TPR) repeat protein
MGANRLFIAAAIVVFAADIAVACGPYFPWQLLDDRATTLKATPKNGFAFEASHLIAAPKDKLRAVEYDPWSESQRQVDFDHAQIGDLPPLLQPAYQDARNAKDDATAFAMTAQLPPVVRLYVAGAVDFDLGQYAAAQKRFQSVFALSANEQKPRAVWAAYMMGRTDLRLSDPRAPGAYQLARTLALHGAPDPLGLAVASFGEEAQIHFYRAVGLLTGSGAGSLLKTGWPEPKDDPNSGAPLAPVDKTFASAELPPQNVKAYGEEIAKAIALYAEQAARGSDIGVQSLASVAENVLAQDARLDAAIRDPLVQKLLVAYVLARVDDSFTSQKQEDFGPPADAGLHRPDIVPSPFLSRLVTAIERARITNPAGADRLAALGYRMGRYDLAAKMAAQSGSALASWVKAKLALQRGDLTGAEQFYGAAVHGFPDAIDSDNRNRVQGESGTVALARGEYVDALAKLYPVANTYWGDVAYVAERVLTVDELKDFVDANVPAPAKPASASGAPSTVSPAQMLRELLARRLVREGRYDDATAYQADEDLQNKTKEYASDLREAANDWGRVDQAEAYYKAAVLARTSGMEMMGAEAAPDFFYYSGDYDTGLGRDSAT